MKRIGLIGGLGPEATVDYYKEIINAFKNGDRKPEYPEIIIYSVNMWDFLEMFKRKEFDKACGYILEKIEALRKAGADFAAITANTPHLLFDALQQKSTLPLISIVEATCHEVMARKLQHPGLFGTGLTMKADFYPQVFQKKGINIAVPDPDDIEIINEKLFSEIELGVFKKETRDLLVSMIEKMVTGRHIDSIILGCTELPLILTKNEYAGIPVLNTTGIHVKEIIHYCRGN
ncbi:MAG: amino acid racemase [Bacteroidales bacterium]|nr:amino acid racemase [Bacteroidales bacterium]